MEATVDAIVDVMGSAFDPAFGEAWNRQQVLDALLFPRTHGLLAIDGNVVDARRSELAATTCAGFLLSRAAPGEEELLLLAVKPQHRRQGIATRLMEHFKRAAEARGAEKIFLEMRVNNPARDFYEAQGFVPVGTRPGYYRQKNGSMLDAITFRCDMRK